MQRYVEFFNWQNFLLKFCLTVGGEGLFFEECVAEGVDYVDNVVACAFEVGDDVHVVDACLVLVFSVVDVLDVLRAEAVAHVVDFALFVVRVVERPLGNVLEVGELGDHHPHGVVDIGVHCVDVVVDLFGELGSGFDFSVENLSDAEATVGD